MLELSVLNDLRPLARGAHFSLSALAALSVYLLISRTSSGKRTSLTFLLSALAALYTHCFLDLVLKVP